MFAWTGIAIPAGYSKSAIRLVNTGSNWVGVHVCGARWRRDDQNAGHRINRKIVPGDVTGLFVQHDLIMLDSVGQDPPLLKLR